MKRSIILFTLFPILSFGQFRDSLIFSLDTAALRQQAFYIMKEIGCPIRPNYHLGDDLTIAKNDTLPEFSAHFKAASIVRPDKNINLRFYIKPQIDISSNMDSIFKGLGTFSDFDKLVAATHLLHEYVHFYQKTYPPDTIEYFRLIPEYQSNVWAFAKYMRQPVEFEAFAVASYYFLYFYDRQKLIDLHNNNNDLMSRLILIMSAYRKAIRPNWPDMAPYLQQ